MSITQKEDRTMRDEDYDEGLVHGHGWAREPARPAVAPAPKPDPERDHDEGLVHAHSWARTEQQPLGR